jgi:hypothetical protein
MTSPRVRVRTPDPAGNGSLIRPHEGATVLGQINRKNTFGQVMLETTIAVGREVYQLLNDSKIPFQPICGANLGTTVAVPEKYCMKG